jgi:hypothetical protein
MVHSRSLSLKFADGMEKLPINKGMLETFVMFYVLRKEEKFPSAGREMILLCVEPCPCIDHVIATRQSPLS